MVVGIGRISDIGEQKYFRNSDSPVWTRAISHRYPQEGVRLPYQEYLNQDYDVENILCEVPNEAREDFSYVANHVSDDVAIGVIEELLEALRAVEREGLVEGDWEEKIEWLENVLIEVWQERGLHPGLGSVLEFLEVESGNLYHRRVLSKLEENGGDPLRHVEDLLSGNAIPREPFEEHEFLVARTKWRNLSNDKQDLLRALSGIDLTPEQVERVIDSTIRGDSAISATVDDLRSNLYLLAEQDKPENELEPIRFETIDRTLHPTELDGMPPGFLQNQIAPKNDKRRIRALLFDVLDDAKNRGDTLLSIQEATDLVTARLTDERACQPRVDDIRDEIGFYNQALVVDLGTEPESIALPSLRRREETIASSVRDLVENDPETEDIDWSSILDDTLSIEEAAKLDPSIEERAQREKLEALDRLYTSKFSVLKGSAGTGKTTVVRTFIEGLNRVEGEFSKLLLAPTGKARVRLEDATESNAQTIHQFLMKNDWIDPNSFRLKESGGESVGVHTVIVDEASMIATDLLATLFDALDLDEVKRVVLIGDPNQIPPIGPGRPFFDIIRWLEKGDQIEKIGELSQQVRFQSKEGQARQLAEVFAGDNTETDDEIMSTIAKGDISGDLELTIWDNVDDLFTELNHTIREILNKFGGDDDIDSFDRSIGYKGESGNPESWQILSPTRVKPYGTDAINRHLQVQYRQDQIDDPEILAFGDEQLVAGDKVIQTQNEKRWTPDENDVYVANGEIGIIAQTKNNYGKQDTLKVEFTTQDQPLYYFASDVNDRKIELAYGLTVHKSQGSEFERVILVLPKDAPTLSRELLYTALTRYKDQLTILLEDTVSRLFEFRKTRYSNIRKRNTNTFEPSIRPEINVPYPQNLIHKTRNEELVRSKSEVIVADTLSSLGLNYEYEERLESPENEDDFRLPDFTVYHNDEQYYWEHLGLTDDIGYQRRWKRKLEWYEDCGFADRLIISEDGPDGSIDSKEIEEIARDRIMRS